MNQKTTIIPIASGKGGVGKSILAANLSMALAETGRKTVTADLDLGGSNLYTCLGLPNSFPGIGDFLKAKNISFKKLIRKTEFKNLYFLPGDGKTPFMANITYEQRLALLREIKTIASDYLVLDLGAGTVFNTLNFFGLSNRGIIITTFETPSIMNFVMFLRNFMFRLISSVVRQNKRILNILITAFQQPIASEAVTIHALIDKIRDIDSNTADKVERVCRGYHPRIIFNMVDHPDELDVLPKLEQTLLKGLSIKPEFLGFIMTDEKVKRSAKNRKILLRDFPDCPASRGIRHIANKIAETGKAPIDNDVHRLKDELKRQWSEWKSHKKRMKPEY